MSVQVFCPRFDWVFFFFFLVLSCICCLHILEINPLSVVPFAIIFSHSKGCLFHPVYNLLHCAKAFKFNQVPFVYFLFYFYYSRRWVRDHLCFISKGVLTIFSSKSFIVSGLIYKSLIHFEFIFVYGIRKCSNFSPLQVAVQFSQYHLLKRLSFCHCIVLPHLSNIVCLQVHGFISELFHTVRSQDLIVIHRNPLHSYTLTLKNQEEKFQKQSHSPLQQKD